MREPVCVGKVSSKGVRPLYNSVCVVKALCVRETLPRLLVSS